MNTLEQVMRPPPIATASFMDAATAVARLEEIYQRNTAFLRAQFGHYMAGEPLVVRVRATYPLVRITTASHARLIPAWPTASSQGPARMRPRSRGPICFVGRRSWMRRRRSPHRAHNVRLASVAGLCSCTERGKADTAMPNSSQ
jgi:hypothetical protein